MPEVDPVVLPLGLDATELVKGLKAADNAFSSFVTRTVKKQKDIAASIRGMNAETKKFVSDMAAGLDKSLKKIRSPEARKTLEGLRDQATLFGTSMDKSFRSAAARVTALNAPLQKAGDSLKLVGTEALTSSTKVTKVGDSIGGAGKKASFMETSIKRVAAAFGVMMAMRVAGTIKEWLTSFAEFEASMTKIVALVGVSRTTVDEWSDSIVQMARDTSTSVNELADALYYITSAGIRGAEALKVLEQTAYASSAGLGDMTSIAKTVVSSMNAWGKDP